ncbi:MAG: hypothetical protein HY077_18860 [Elusimicrobia bacterium]|nr:hypothetical protein [Elusimicrobiota bacterium]
MNRGGLVLMQVLVVAVVVGYLCSLILGLLLQSAYQSAGVVGGVTASLNAQAAVVKVTDVWNSAGAVCRSDGAAGVSCAGTGCSCSCTVAGLPAVAARASTGASCVLTAVSP